MKFTDEELISQLEAEETRAVDSLTGILAQERAEALARYKGDPLGNEVEGRSQVVDRSVMDTVEWIMPSLMRIFMGGDEIGKFDPIGPQDEPAADRETDVCNWYVQNRGDFFTECAAALKDALLLKNGYMVVNWRRRYDTMTETYVGLSDEEAAMLTQDQEVTVIEHTDRVDELGQPVHDLKVEMKKCDEYPEPEAVPPDEILVSSRHRKTSLLDADFVEFVRRNVTIGQLREEGFQIDDEDLGDDAFSDSSSIEVTTRDRFGVTAIDRTDPSLDPSRRLVTFRDAYYRVDLRGTGTGQLWRMARISGLKKLVLKEEANIIPFPAFSPIIYPHNHVGISIYDLIADLSIIKTVLQRQMLDGLYLQTSGRVGVDINKVVNLDDLLISRPGGVVRFDGDPNGAMIPIVTPDVSQAVLGGLEYMESQKEGRTGVTRYSAGLDANTLNKTATGVQAIQQAANQRIELIARTLAGGFKDLFLIIHALASKHSTKALQIKLKGDWVQVDPRQWKKRTDFSISVGLGTGTPEQQMQKLLMMQPIQQAAMGLGLAGPQEAYNYGAELWKAAGYKLPDRFIKPPKMVPVTDQSGQPVMGPDGKPQMQPQTPPPQEDPIVQAEKVKAQAQMQMAGVKAQADQQIQATRAQADMAIQQHDAQQKYQLELEKHRMQLQVDDMKHSREQETQIRIAIIKAQAQVDAAQITATKQAEAAMVADPESRLQQ